MSAWLTVGTLAQHIAKVLNQYVGWGQAASIEAMALSSCGTEAWIKWGNSACPVGMLQWLEKCGRHTSMSCVWPHPTSGVFFGECGGRDSDQGH